MTDISDHKILSYFKSEKTKSQGFDFLVKKYQERIYWQVRRMVIDHNDADDVVQEVFIKIWKNLHTFREQSRLYTWIYRVTANEVLGFLNKKKRNLSVSIDRVDGQQGYSLQGDQYFDGDRIQQKFQQALLKLPPRQRLVFQLKYYDELKYKEISDILETSVGSLKASYHHAVKKIEQFLLSD